MCSSHLAPDNAKLSASLKGLGLVDKGYLFAEIVLAAGGIIYAINLKKTCVVVSIPSASVSWSKRLKKSNDKVDQGE